MKEEKTEHVPAVELVEDFTMYPRTGVDPLNVQDIAASLELGRDIPPIIVCRKSKRIVDGFHRKHAYVKVKGNACSVPAKLRDYANDGELYEAAIEANAAHGLKLKHFDRRRILARGRELGIPTMRLAAILRMTKQRAEQILTTETAKGPTSAPFAATGPNGTIIPLKSTLIPLMSGKTLTAEQAEVNRHAGGMKPMFWVNQLLALLMTDMIDLDNEPLTRRLLELRNAIDEKVAVK